MRGRRIFVALFVASLFAALLGGVAVALFLAFNQTYKTSCDQRPGFSCAGQPLVTSTPTIAAAPTTSPGVQQAIDLVVRVGALTLAQATCIFRDHPSVLQEFAQEVALGTTAIISDDALKQRTEELIRKYAVQLDRCFSGAGS